MTLPKAYIISHEKINDKSFAVLIGSINENQTFSGVVYDEVTVKTDSRPISVKTWLDIQNFNQNYLKMEFVAKLDSIPEHVEIINFCKTLVNRKYTSEMFARILFQKITGEKVKFMENYNPDVLTPHDFCGLETISTIEKYFQEDIPKNYLKKQILDEILSAGTGGVLGYLGAAQTAEICYSYLGITGGIAGGVVGALTVGVWSYLESFKHFDRLTRFSMKNILENPTDFSVDDAYNYFGVYPSCLNAEINNVSRKMLTVFLENGQNDEVEKVLWYYGIIAEVRHREVENEKIPRVTKEKIVVKSKNDDEKRSITQIGINGISRVVNLASQVFIKLG